MHATCTVCKMNYIRKGEIVFGDKQQVVTSVNVLAVLFEKGFALY